MRYIASLCIPCLLILCACSNQQLYEGVKAGTQANCLNYPEAEYRECMEVTRDSYEAYKQKRDDARDE